MDAVDATTDEGAPPTLEQAEYYSIPYRVVGTLCLCFILVVGVAGNALVCLVIKSNRSMHTPTNCYLLSLAAADCVVLLSSVPNEILSYYLIGNKWIFGRAGCALFTCLQYWAINCSSLCLEAFTVERFIAICLPMRAHKICTVKRARAITYFIWAFSFLYSSPWLFLAATKPIRYRTETCVQCTFNLTREKYSTYFLIDVVLYYVLPLLISFVLYGLIIRMLLFERMAPIEGHGPFLRRCRKQNKVAKMKIQVVKMLIAVVIIFAFLWLPYRGLLLYNSYATRENIFMDLWYLMFAKTCIYINSAINPFLYSALSRKFRRAFYKILPFRKSSRPSSSFPYSERETA